MKVLLVNAPVPHYFKMFDYCDEAGKQAIKRRILVGPPLALNEIAGMIPEDDIYILDQKTDVDADPDYDFETAFVKKAQEFQPDIIGFTVMTSQFNSVVRLLNHIPELDKRPLTIVGGLHATTNAEEFIGKNVDVIITGIGKATFKEVVDAYKLEPNNPEFECIVGIALPQGDAMHYTKKLCELSYDEIRDLKLCDDVIPNRTLTNRYDYRIPKINKTIHYISTSQGCTHKCNFCCIWKMAAGKYFHKDVDTIIKELKTMDDYEIIRMCDANTFGDVKKATDLFQRIIDEGLDKHMYMADVRTDTVIRNPEVLELAAKAGLKVVVCGLESISDEQLKAYGKANTVDNIKKALVILNEMGIMVNGNYIVRPDFVESDFDELGQFVMENPIFNSAFTILTPLPGTAQWDQYKDQITDHNYDAYNLTNAVVPTTLPIDQFYSKINDLYKLSQKSTEKYFKLYGELNREINDQMNGARN